VTARCRAPYPFAPLSGEEVGYNHVVIKLQVYTARVELLVKHR
jgi:hypothetical protein